MSAPWNQPREFGELAPDMPSRMSLWLASLAMRSWRERLRALNIHHGKEKIFHGKKKIYHAKKKSTMEKKSYHGMVKYQKRTLKPLQH